MAVPPCPPPFLADPELDLGAQLASCAEAGCSTCLRDSEEPLLRAPRRGHSRFAAHQPFPTDVRRVSLLA